MYYYHTVYSLQVQDQKRKKAQRVFGKSILYSIEAEKL